MSATLSLLLLALPAPRLAALRVDAGPLLDGRLDDRGWQSAAASDAFTQRVPDEGRPPTERTIVRVIYDANALYVGIDCQQRGVPVVERLTRRDRSASGDRMRRRDVGFDADEVAVSIGSRADRTSAFHFIVNAAGVLSDGLYFDDTEFDGSWDENWEAVTARTELGWSAEFRIPLRVLRFDTLPTQEWGFNVRRTIALRQEVDEWAFVPRTEAGYVSRFGRLENLTGIEPPTADLELRPFVVSKAGRQDASFGPPHATAGVASYDRGWRSAAGSSLDWGGSVGIDGRWHLTRDLTLDGTINPDFGQVEADELVLNLTTVETFYPEKRPFFLEGLDIFSTPLSVLYTRRIGRVAPMPDLPMGESPSATLGPTAIPGALKLAGRLTERLSVGLLSAITSANELPVISAEGAQRLRVADPVTLFNVVRLKRAVGGNAHLGTVFAATNRFERPALYPTTADGLLACPGHSDPKGGGRCFRDAYVLAADGRWRSSSGDYSASAQSAASLMSSGQPQTLSDGTVLGPGDLGSGTTLNVAKDGGRHWLWQLGANLFSRHFELNDAGYLPRQNLASGSLDVIYRTKDPWWIARETASKIELRHRRNLAGLVLANLYQINTSATLRNYWSFFTELHYRAAYFDDREVGDGTALERAGLLGWEWTVRGDPRGAISGNLSGTIQRRTNGWRTEIEGGILVRPLSQLDLELLPTWSQTAGEPRFLEQQSGGRLLFGSLAATQLGGIFRMTYTFTPRLTLQTYAQLFLARGEYSNFSTHDRPASSRSAIHLRDLVPGAPAPDERADFQQAALNASLVLRWEYRLGSTLYLVYTRSQLPELMLDPEDRPRLDLSVLPRAPAADVFLLKLSYWWG